MTAVPDAAVETDAAPHAGDLDRGPAVEPPATATDPAGTSRSRLHTGSFAGVIRWTVALGAAVLIYALFLAVNGADPVEALRAMWDSAFGDSTGNRHSDELLRELAGGPVMWTAAKRAVGLAHAADMDEAVRVLVEAGRISIFKEPGRKARWLTLGQDPNALNARSTREGARANGSGPSHTYAQSTAADAHIP